MISLENIKEDYYTHTGGDGGADGDDATDAKIIEKRNQVEY